MTASADLENFDDDLLVVGDADGFEHLTVFPAAEFPDELLVGGAPREAGRRGLESERARGRFPARDRGRVLRELVGVFLRVTGAGPGASPWAWPCARRGAGPARARGRVPARHGGRGLRELVGVSLRETGGGALREAGDGAWRAREVGGVSLREAGGRGRRELVGGALRKTGAGPSASPRAWPCARPGGGAWGAGGRAPARDRGLVRRELVGGALRETGSGAQREHAGGSLLEREPAGVSRREAGGGAWRARRELVGGALRETGGRGLESKRDRRRVRRELVGGALREAGGGARRAKEVGGVARREPGGGAWRARRESGGGALRETGRRGLESKRDRRRVRRELVGGALREAGGGAWYASEVVGGARREPGGVSLREAGGRGLESPARARGRFPAQDRRGGGAWGAREVRGVSLREAGGRGPESERGRGRVPARDRRRVRRDLVGVSLRKTGRGRGLRELGGGALRESGGGACASSGAGPCARRGAGPGERGRSGACPCARRGGGARRASEVGGVSLRETGGGCGASSWAGPCARRGAGPGERAGSGEGPGASPRAGPCARRGGRGVESERGRGRVRREPGGVSLREAGGGACARHEFVGVSLRKTGRGRGLRELVGVSLRETGGGCGASSGAGPCAWRGRVPARARGRVPARGGGAGPGERGRSGACPSASRGAGLRRRLRLRVRDNGAARGPRLPPPLPAEATGRRRPPAGPPPAVPPAAPPQRMASSGPASPPGLGLPRPWRRRRRRRRPGEEEEEEEDDDDDAAAAAAAVYLSDEAYELSSAESGSSLRFYSDAEGGPAGSSSSLLLQPPPPPPPLPPPPPPPPPPPGPERKRPSRYEVVTELGPEEVRWFFREDKKTWKPFIGYDSLRIELAFRARPEARPEEEAEEEEEGASPPLPEPVCVRGGLYEVDVAHGLCNPVYWNQTDKIPVMRGQWFIDGTWQPLEEEESNLIEQEHLSCFKGQQMQENFDIEVPKPLDGKDGSGINYSVVYHLPPFSLPSLFKWRGYKESADDACLKRKRSQAVHSFKLSRNHVDWHSMDEVYLYSDATTSKIARTVTQKLGFSKASSSGTRLHRGYVEEATLEDKPSQTTHIVFVVHGIGQKMDQGRIIKNTAMMRDAARKIEEKHFSNHATHVEFLPVEWRSKLALDGDTVDSITPDKVRGLRDMLNSSAMDIMYYTSPLYRDELVKGLQQELNRLYSLFCSRNPDFEAKGGKVSIVSHSLGCVITYDIMTGWNPVRLYEQLLRKEREDPAGRWLSFEERHLLDELYITQRRMREIEERLQGLKPVDTTKTPALKFKVENFFCMGSPLAVFLALRGIRPGTSGSQDHILPRVICNRLLNIFHPTDPVAYRLEPLILKHYSNISPVQIHWYNTTNPLPYEHMKPSFLNPAKEPTSAPESDSLSSIPSPVTSPVMARRHYGESITNIGKASILGAASIGKGLGGMLFSRFGRSSSSTSSQSSETSSKEGMESGEDKKAGGAQPVLPAGAPQPFPHSSSGFLDSTYFRLQESFLNLPQLLFPGNVMENKGDFIVELDHRIDFELREGLVESRYWSAVTSHTAYWSSLDIALFLLTFMYKHEQDEDEKRSLEPI
ncbi:phospholipase DDHD1 [Tachyglossus aculeatus]|uniref:phospholipase DDHD1 n=1 Tax=Tachyglossus aculeatus TaxID=9261 RepID=UPI0018F60E3C|nr:phospholipase DDHD1 [Tachyglossus aculeatus]